LDYLSNLKKTAQSKKSPNGRKFALLVSGRMLSTFFQQGPMLRNLSAVKTATTTNLLFSLAFIQ
jgi:hypothetical protein